MNLNDYQQLSKRTMKECVTYRDALAEYTLGIGGEAGEVVDHVKKHLYHGHDISIEDVTGELGDVMFYVAAVATTLGIRLEDIAQHNIQKLLKRYPNGFEESRSIDREE